MEKAAKIKVGDLILEAYAAEGEANFQLSPAHASFQVNQGSPDISLGFRFGSGPTLPRGQLVFDSGGVWSLYDDSRQFFIPLVMPDSGEPPYAVAILDRSFSRGEVFIRLPEENLPKGGSTDRAFSRESIDPFHFPLDEVLMLNFLAQGRGLILHACGVDDQGRGRLFVGESGAGKSTLAELWKGTDATLLSDDRVIVRRVEGRWRIYGTPWHGDARISSPASAPLERIYFLRHGSQNAVQPLSVAEAASELMVCCFPPFYDKAGMEFTLELIGQLASEIPCHALGFVATASAVDFIRGEH